MVLLAPDPAPDVIGPVKLVAWFEIMVGVGDQRARVAILTEQVDHRAVISVERFPRAAGEGSHAGHQDGPDQNGGQRFLVEVVKRDRPAGEPLDVGGPNWGSGVEKAGVVLAQGVDASTIRFKWTRLHVGL